MLNVNTSLGKIKVLLAEDNEVNKLLAKSILHHWGLEAKTAHTGFEAIEMLQNEDFDVILMDIQMPEKNGIEATQEIRNLPDEKKKNIPIIALTANALKGEEKKYLAAGMNDYLTKPFKEKELLEVIRKYVNVDSDAVTVKMQKVFWPAAFQATHKPHLLFYPMTATPSDRKTQRVRSRSHT